MKLLLLLLILFNLNLVIGIQILEIEGYVNQYSGSPQYSNGEGCTFMDIKFLIVNENINENIDVVEAPPLSTGYAVSNSDNNARIYQFSSPLLPFGISSFTIKVNLTNGDVGPSYSFQFSCGADYSNAIIRPTGQQLRKLDYQDYCVPFYIEGINFNIQILNLRLFNVDYSVRSNGGNAFCWILPYAILENPNIQIYGIEVTLGVYVYAFNFTSPFINKSNSLSSIETFPPTSAVFTEPAADITALLMFTSNTTPLINSPYQYLLANNSGFNMNYTAYPSYGVKGAITYIAPFNDRGIVDETLTSFYFRFLSGNGLLVNLQYDKTMIVLTPQSLPSLSVTSISSNIDLPIFDVEFTQYDYKFNLYIIQFANSNMKVSAPYGLYRGGGNGGLVLFKVSPIRSKGSSAADNAVVCASFNPSETGSCQRVVPINGLITDYDEPTITSIQLIHLVDSIHRLIINVFDVSGISFITSPSFITSKSFMDSLISGDIYNGNYEFLVDINKEMTLTISDVYENIHNTFIQDYLVFNTNTFQFSQYRLPDIVTQTFTFSSFLNVSFERNNLNLTLIGDSYNTIYIKVLDINSIIDKQLQLQLMDPISFDKESQESKGSWPIKYDSTLLMYTGKFVLPKNTIFGNIPYLIRISPTQVFSSFELFELLGEQSQLNVIDSYLDNEGPMVDTIFKSYGLSGSDFNSTLIGWSLHIIDNVGFSYGYIKVMASIDNSIYHFNFTNGNLSSNGYIDILIETIKPCYSQDYVIVYASFVDVNNVESIYQMYTSIPKPSRNPFRKVLEDTSSGLKISFICPAFTLGDTTPPTLTQFTPSTTNINILGSSADRVLSFTLKIEDLESGIKKHQLPIIYITSNKMDILECVTKIASEIDPGKSYVYTCSIELPYGFGYPSNLAYSIYGLINNYGLYKGYTTTDLISHFTITNSYLIPTTSPSSFGVSPGIISHNPITIQGGRLILFGYSLQSIDASVEIEFLDPGFVIQTYPITSNTPSSIIIDSIPASNGKPYIVSIFKSGGKVFSYTVEPIYYNSNDPVPTISPTNTPRGTPTNTPKNKCIGNPECGGNNNGYCNTDNYCVCFSPWVGIDCTSKIIIVPKPITNNTNPSTEIPITNGGSNEQTSNYLFKSLISIVSLRELNFNGKEVIKTIEFDKWIFSEINSKKNKYFTNFTVGNDNNGNQIITNVTIELEWFYNSTTIQFASSNLTMNPSTIKYTIEITKYPFISNLNQLQLIMSAQFESSNSHVCSLNEFGELSNDGDNYLKIQIEDHSLYGRFIKRAVIDSRISNVSNQLLDSSYNEITNTGEPKLNSFIGITIPNYQRLIIVDPDFSILLDNNQASDNDNSICTNNTSPKLKPSQIAGIVIGVIAFTAVIVTSITYHIIKKKKQIAFKNNIVNKLKEIK